MYDMKFKNFYKHFLKRFTITLINTDRNLKTLTNIFLKDLQ